MHKAGITAKSEFTTYLPNCLFSKDIRIKLNLFTHNCASLKITP